MQDGQFCLLLLKTSEKRLMMFVESLKERIQDLEGVLTNTKYNDKRKYPDDKLSALISHFNFS